MCGHDRRRAWRLVAILHIMVGSMEEMLRQLDLLILTHDRGSKLTDDVFPITMLPAGGTQWR
jgi:hypothetical protein